MDSESNMGVVIMSLLMGAAMLAEGLQTTINSLGNIKLVSLGLFLILGGLLFIILAIRQMLY